MRFIKMNCQNCNGQLDFDLDKMQTYCPYCGQKLLFDVSQLEVVLKEREKTKREQEKTKREEEKTKQILLEHEYKEREEKRAIKVVFGCFLFVLLLSAFCFIMAKVS